MSILIFMGLKRKKSKESKSKLNNKKTIYDNITFKSKLEVNCYKKLVAAGFNPEYEPHVFKLFDKFNLSSVKYFCPFPIKGKKSYGLYPRIIMGITYTPDFYFEYNNHVIYFDTKGQPNDVYPLKKKMFLKILQDLHEKNGKNYIFFEPHNINQIEESINVILNL